MTKPLVVGICSVALVAAHVASGRLIPTPIGAAAAYHPSAKNGAAENAHRIGRLTCERGSDDRVGVHLELFAHGLAAIVPAGIGMAPPLRRSGAYVVSSRCSYPIRTREPTGVLEVRTGGRFTLGDFFAIWGRAVSPHVLGPFRMPDTRLRAYVNGRRHQGPAAAIVLRRHREIVLELGKFIPPHAAYRFRKGL